MPRTLYHLALWLALVLVARPVAWAEGTTPEVAPGEFIIHWRGEAARLQLTRVAGRSIATSREIGPRSTVYRLSEATKRATRDALTALEGQPEIAAVEPNYIRRAFRKPNDVNFPLQWNITAVKLDQAWDRSTGNPGIVVAVIDSGILPTHPDLAGRLLPGYDFISDPQSANDGDGWDGDPEDTGTDSLQSSAFHGTHVAGIIGASSNNQKGMVGADWRCKILPVRTLGIQEGKGKDSDIAAAIRWAAGVQVADAPANPNPARVINLSFGGPGKSTTLTQAVKDAMAKGAVVVAAAGNQGTEGSDIYPAAIEGVITVGATQIDGKRAGYSNYGSVVDLMAPGGNMNQKLPFQFNGTTYPAGIMGTLFSTQKNKYTYHFFEGTSQAAPLVAGIVSLMLTVNPSLNTAESLNILKSSAQPNTTCNEGCGAGLVDASAALAATGGGQPGNGTKLPFSSSCSADTECSQGVCRQVASGAKICTQFCSLDTHCPDGSSCNNGLCTPPPGSGSTHANTGGMLPGQTVWGGGCQIPAAPSSDLDWSLVGLLLMLLALHRLDRRRSKT